MIAFAGTVPENYERHLRPILFEPYAVDLAARVSGDRILEIACGTGVLTEALLADSTVIATDLNQGMIDVARQKVRSDRVSWRQADATHLPFVEREFDGVVCQFGFMFVPDKLAAFREARRVLRDNGQFVFNVWDSLAANDASRLLNEVLHSMFPDNPPRFVEIPFSMYDRGEIERLLRAAGFREIKLTDVWKTMAHSAARQFATGMVRGSPLFDQLTERSADYDRVIDEVTAAIARHKGPQRMCAIVVEAKPTARSD